MLQKYLIRQVTNRNYKNREQEVGKGKLEKCLDLIIKCLNNISLEKIEKNEKDSNNNRCRAG